jgi:hypothetical protein
MVANSAYAALSGLALFENARSISPKVTVIDVTTSVAPAGSQEEKEMRGSVRFFNNEDSPVHFPDGIYYCQIKVLLFTLCVLTLC